MLPEYLYTVSTSMQEISRDDFNLLNGSGNVCDKDLCTTLSGTVSSASAAADGGNVAPSTMSKQNENSLHSFDLSALNAIKLEDNTGVVDLFPTQPNTWQQHPLNSHEHAHHRLNPGGSSKLLLQNSDDPMICRGASGMNAMDDDHPAEFKTLIAAAVKAEGRKQQQQQLQKQQLEQRQSTESAMQRYRAPAQRATSQAIAQPPKRPQNGCSSLTKQQLKVKAGLMSAQNQQKQQQQSQQPQQPNAPPTQQRNARGTKKKANVKLRFHHQALPPEYLNHLEATQQQQVTSNSPDPPQARPKSNTTAKAPSMQPPPTTKNSHENVRSWLQKIAEIQRTAEKQRKNGTDNETQPDSNNNRTKDSPVAINTITTNATKRSQEEPNVNVLLPEQSLGALTQKPVRRVVHYADLPFMGEITLNMSKPRRGRKPKKADICHLIYKNYGTILPGTPGTKQDSNANTLKTENTGHDALKRALEQPLNLCLRDQSNEHYSISSGEDDDDYVDDDDDDDNDDETEGNAAVRETSRNSNCPTPHNFATPINANDQLLSNNMKQSMQSIEESLEHGQNCKPTSVLLHPVSVYYQRLLEAGQQAFGLPIETIEKDNQLALKIPIPNGLLNGTIPTSTTTPATTPTPKLERTSPTNLSGLPDYPEPMSTPSSLKSESSSVIPANAVQPQIAAQKRKRSAIFIPPIPAENTSNPATEVSICKFKFTGGSKPTLQEKKMLSVDADGNYRYFSGTGDKSMRGYEFFPRESLQQSGLLPGVNCTGAFLNATGERMSLDIPPPSAGLSHELLQIPDSPTSTLLLPSPTPHSPTVPNTAATTNSTYSPLAAVLNSTLLSGGGLSEAHEPPLSAPGGIATTSVLTPTQRTQRKSKTRRPSQREKFEKTFKEKGFLIQTQQLESAEGATYCKFRQLKKFTRYLFRNWKDYLPENGAAATTSMPSSVVKNSDASGGVIESLGRNISSDSIIPIEDAK